MLKKWHVLVSITIAVSFITVLSISAEDSLIPAWIKSTAGFWVNNQISDKEFISALQWLIDNEILTVSSSTPSIDKEMADVDKELELIMKKRMLECANNPELCESDSKNENLSPISMGYQCVQNVSADPYNPGQMQFIVELVNLDTVSHSPIIEIQLTDVDDRPIITEEIQIDLKPKETKTSISLVQMTHVAKYCNVVMKSDT